MNADILCRVVDNYGDIGVCWRLARQLHHEHGLEVRLWVDDLRSFARICPGLDIHAAQQSIAGVTISPLSLVAEAQPADAVICAFGCDLPGAYLERMAAGSVAPVWINLEYLSAEDWIEGCHLLPSPHPRLPLQQHFFYPGFTPRTGGLLREQDLLVRQAAWREDSRQQQEFWHMLGLPPAPANELRISLFSYDQPDLDALFKLWDSGNTPITCLVPEGVLAQRIPRWLGQNGSLQLKIIPFLMQPDYDQLLALCDLNFVRGEDSFVRAQWAQRPLVWHIYPQQEQAHLTKLQAFMQRYLAGLDKSTGTAVTSFWDAWNAPEKHALTQTWPDFLAAQAALRVHAVRWAQELAQQEDLATQLVRRIRQSVPD